MTNYAEGAPPRREEQLRIQALGAALSRRDWHAIEQAYNAIRDEFDRRPGKVQARDCDYPLCGCEDHSEPCRSTSLTGWNEAIEAAAEHCEQSNEVTLAEQIRSMRRSTSLSVKEG